MKKIIIILFVIFLGGCAGLAPKETVLRHENDEKNLLTEAEFEDRVSQTVEIIYEGFLAISEAAKGYALDNSGRLPSGNYNVTRKLLVEGGYIKKWPVVPPFAFADHLQHDFRYSGRYGDMDGKGAFDDVLFVQDLKVEVCEEFARRYASPGFRDAIHQYEGNKNKGPGEIVGRHIKIYAISWEKEISEDYCDINWVMKYND